VEVSRARELCSKANTYAIESVVAAIDKAFDWEDVRRVKGESKRNHAQMFAAFAHSLGRA
jgi:hypothetical protein